jgi:hypothetical protein
MPLGPAIVLAVFLIYGITFVWSSLQRRRQRRRLIARLESDWGSAKAEPESGSDLGYYHATRFASHRGTIDPTTWADLDLDEVFRFLDRTQSVLGREVLYSRLRDLDTSEAERESFDALVGRLGDGSTRRLTLQSELAAITERSATTAWQLALAPLDPPPAWMSWGLPAAAAAMAAVTASAALHPSLLPAIMALFLLMLVVRVRITGRIAPWTSPLASVGRALGAAAALAASEPEDEPTTATLRSCLPHLRRLDRLARWMGRDPSRSDLGALIVEYLNWFFNVDGLAMLLADREVRRHRDELLRLLEALGRLDAATAVASVRAGAKGRWCWPKTVPDTAPVRMVGLVHPLVEGCVPNTITLGPVDGIILTGANMTGKSTFLRAVGVNTVLARALTMAFAEAFETPRMTLRSCIDAADSLAEGKSLYQAEAETVVSILAHARQPGVTLCLFDELFRGTNSVDRIAASAASYSYLAEAADGCRCLVIAATHDLELVPALAGQFAPYHFGDRIAADRLEFEYRLRPGVAPSRNAIALLQILGAPPLVVEQAHLRAAALGD